MEGDTAVDSIKIKTMSIKIKAQSYIYTCVCTHISCESHLHLYLEKPVLLVRILSLGKGSLPRLMGTIRAH